MPNFHAREQDVEARFFNRSFETRRLARHVRRIVLIQQVSDKAMRVGLILTRKIDAPGRLPTPPTPPKAAINVRRRQTLD